MKETERLILEKIQPGDFNRFFEIHSDPQTNLFNPAGPMDHETARKSFNDWMLHWDQHQFGSWTIKQKETGATIGFGGLSYRMYGDELKLNLGYRFDANSWGKGYATELAAAAIQFGFEELDVQNIFAVVRPAHTASIKVLEKIGMIYFGTLDDVPGQAESLVFILSRE